MNRPEPTWLDPHLSDDEGADLIHGLLAPSRERECLEHLRDCPECEGRFRQLAATFERGRALYGSVRTGEVEPARPQGGPLPGADHSTRLRRWFGVGVGLAAAAALLLYARPERTAGPRFGAAIDNPWLPAGGAEVQTRSDGSAFSESLRLGIDAYEARDLATARRVLEALQPQGGREAVRRLYLADVQYRQGEPALALATLERVDFLRLPDPWRSRAYRTLLLSLEATGQRDRVDALRSQLTGDPGEIGAFVRSLDRRSPRQ